MSMRGNDVAAAANGGALRLGVIGLGSMGLPMGARLAGTHHVMGFDPAAGRNALAAERGVHVVDSVAAAARDAAVLILAVRDLPQVNEVRDGNLPTVGLKHKDVVREQTADARPSL
jgi:3-hydroxyisobutyrate dehydrogenase-like beta-hydroxyacid dehydrogenase